MLEVNQRDLAAGLRVSAKTVQQWDREGLRDAARLESKGRSARYDAFAAFHWWHERELARLTAGSPDSDPVEAAKLRKLEAEAEAQEMKLAELRGSMVPMDDVEGMLREGYESVDSALKVAPSRHAASLAKQAGISVKKARIILRSMLDPVRALIRDGRGR